MVNNPVVQNREYKKKIDILQKSLENDEEIKLLKEKIKQKEDIYYNKINNLKNLIDENELKIKNVGIMQKSQLYNLIVEQHNKKEAVNFYKEELKKRNITTYNEIIDLYENKIEYTKENIKKYVDFISYMQFDFQDRIANFIIKKYILNHMFLEDIALYHCILYNILNLCQTLYNNLNDANLNYISKYISIENLNIYWNTNITSLNPVCNTLRILDISRNVNVNDFTLKHCHNITKLIAFDTLITTCEPFANTLIELDISGKCKVDDYGLRNCVNLQILIADKNEYITTCRPFAKSIIKLNIQHTNVILNEKYDKLETLYINDKINDLRNFNALVYLDVYACKKNIKGLNKCSNLKTVIIAKDTIINKIEELKDIDFILYGKTYKNHELKTNKSCSIM